MSRKYRITGIDLGDDIQNIEVYHTSITASNKLFGPVTRSLLVSPGYEVEVDDDVSIFHAREHPEEVDSSNDNTSYN